MFLDVAAEHYVGLMAEQAHRDRDRDAGRRIHPGRRSATEVVQQLPRITGGPAASYCEEFRMGCPLLPFVPASRLPSPSVASSIHAAPTGRCVLLTRKGTPFFMPSPG